MAKQSESFFLEEWLWSTTCTSHDKIGSSTSAQPIIQAWACLRELLKDQLFQAHHLQALNILVSSQASLHVADPQAKILLSILSQRSLSLPEESYPLIFRLLYIWVRKSRQPPLSVDSAIDIVVQLFSPESHTQRSSLFFSEGILLLGAISYRISGDEKLKRDCLDILCKLLEAESRHIFLFDKLASNVLAGIGYALSSSSSPYFGKLLDLLFKIWDKSDGSSGNILQGLMLLHLIEWVLSSSLSLRSLDKIYFLRDVLESDMPNHSSFSVVMAAAGVLRAVNRSGLSGFIHVINCAESRIEIVARDLVSRIKSFGHSVYGMEISLLLQCLAVALARSGSVVYQSSLFISLSLALLSEVFPLQRIYGKVLNIPKESWKMVLGEIKEHLSSVIFKEAGAITGVFCNLYASADEDSQNTVENLIWVYCEEVYFWHQQAMAVQRGSQGNLIGEIEKIAESAFLMIVIFALGVTKHKLQNKINGEAQLQLAVRILVSFSCIEYFRRMRLSEYMDTIRVVIVSVQENELACTSFLESMPSYDDLIRNPGPSNLPLIEYAWSADEVQTARIVFYMRVIPTCIERLSASVFRKNMVPTMFLFIGHPSGKISRYAHSMFVAFISSGTDSSEDEKVVLKEQLAYYYIQRTLEGFPQMTPFEGMASGVVALVRHLPAGCSSVFYCIKSLVEKLNSLYSAVNNHDSDIWRNLEGEFEPAKKVLDLLLGLLFIVDIQVLPILMKSLAQLIVQLPLNVQNMLLNKLYLQIAESDDVIRKPTLISWLQSLSYLCSQSINNTEPVLVREVASSRTMGSLAFNRIHARI